MLPEGDESPERVTYQAASPDEAALVTAAKNFGFFFYRLEFSSTDSVCLNWLKGFKFFVLISNFVQF